MKNRSGKGGGGVMILSKKTIKLSKVDISLNTAEVIKVAVKEVNDDLTTYAGVYIPPLTNAWTRNEHQVTLEETLNKMERLVSRDRNVFIVGDFNIKKKKMGGKNISRRKLMEQ